MSYTYLFTSIGMEILSATARPVCVFRLSSVTGKMGECVRVVTSSLFFSELWLYTDSGKLPRFMCTNVCVRSFLSVCMFVGVHLFVQVLRCCVVAVCLFVDVSVCGCDAYFIYIIFYTD